jgi:hypothetical protein
VDRASVSGMPPWVYDPHSGGNKIPPHSHEAICKQAQAFAISRPWYPRIQLKLRFKSPFCYVDTLEEGDQRLFPLCRLRYFAQDRWSLALFTYSNERYSPCLVSDGKWEGTLKAALQVCERFIL